MCYGGITIYNRAALEHEVETSTAQTHKQVSTKYIWARKVIKPIKLWVPIQ